MSDFIKHECGIALIRLLKPLSYYIEKYKTPLYALNKLYILMEKQHNRGQDGAGVGIVSIDVPVGKEYIYHNRSIATSPIQDIFNQIYTEYDKFSSQQSLFDVQNLKNNLPFFGELLLGHLRYGTYGENSIDQCHPFYRPNNYKTKSLLLAGNFNLTNVDELFQKLIELGQYPVEKADTVLVLEKIGHFLEDENEKVYRQLKEQGWTKKEATNYIIDNINVENVLRRAAKDFDGGFVLGGLIGHGDSFVLRDPSGIRPAFYYKDDEVIVVASEKPAIRTAFNLPYQEIKELDPGHAIIIRKNGDVSISQILTPLQRQACSFERIYFSRGTDEDIYIERKNLGKMLSSKVLDEIDYDIDHTVFSFIPNTAEVAFLGLTEGVREYLLERKKNKILGLKNINDKILGEIIGEKIRIEKIAVKDTKIRTFITEDKKRKDLVSHVYDSTYGLIKTGVDNLVVLDDSIVRGTTLKESIISTLDRLHPKKLIIVSSAPQIRYPDCYGIDMSKLKDFVAFRAAIELIREKGKDYIIKEVYRKCKAQENLKSSEVVNHVKEIYKQSTTEEITEKIIEMVKPDNMFAQLRIIYQSIEDLHVAIPNHSGDWYFTGNFPTPGGNKVVNRAFINYYEGKDTRAY